MPSSRRRLNDAQVGKLWNGGAGNGVHGLQRVEGGVEGGAGGEQQILRLGRPAQLGDLVDERRKPRGGLHAEHTGGGAQAPHAVILRVALGAFLVHPVSGCGHRLPSR